jgi:NTE family protein
MIKNLVLSGGAIGSVSILGALECLISRKKIKLEEINRYIGSSGGSIICLFLAIGYNIEQIMAIITDFMKKYNSLPKREPTEVFVNLIDNYGIDDGEYIKEWIDFIIFNKINITNPTFIEFVKHTGKDIQICSSNISTYSYELFSVENTPNVVVSDAIRASIAIPILFTPKMINECYYVDSGLLNNFPINYIKDTNVCGKDTLGICLLSKMNKKNKIENIFKYLINIVTTVSNNDSLINSPFVSEKGFVIYKLLTDCSSINFDTDDIKFKIDKDIIQGYYQDGYNQLLRLL